MSKCVRKGRYIVYPEEGKVLLPLRKGDDAASIRQQVPGIAIKEHKGWHIAVLPLHEDTSVMLRNMGYDTSYCEPYHYRYNIPLIEGCHRPFEHQTLTSAFLTAHKRAFCTNTMRTGKTGSVVTAADYLQSVKGVEGAVLIVCTVSNITGVWMETLRSTLPDKKVVVLHGGTGKAARLAKLNQDADYFIINYDGVSMIADELAKEVERGRISIIVIDELTHYGNVSTARWKAMNRVVNGKIRPVPYCWGLTGSPAADSEAVYGFVKLVNPPLMPCRSKRSWKEMVKFPYGEKSWQWKDKKDAPAVIQRVMQPTIRFDKEDVMDLPPVLKQHRTCELSKDQEHAYREMQDHMIAIAKSGEVIEAVNKAAKVTKLLQIAAGSVKDESGEIINYDNDNRIQTILNIVKEEARGKVVIFAPFTGVINRLVDQIRAAGYTCDKVNGQVSRSKRDKIFHAFQHDPDPHVIICHPETTAFGVELAAADIMIFNGPPRSGGFVFEQAIERLSSHKQKAERILMIMLSATREERQAFVDLQNGVSASASTNRLFVMATAA